MEVSARKGSWLSKQIRIPVSASTCLRILDYCVIPARNGIRQIIDLACGGTGSLAKGRNSCFGFSKYLYLANISPFCALPKS